jgi:hypothetical protein
METIQEQSRKPRTIAEVVRDQQERLDSLEGKTSEPKKLKMPFKWQYKLNQASKKAKVEEIPCLIFTKEGWLDGPIYLKIKYGNLITWHDQAYKYRPEALWKMRGIKKTPFVYAIKEIDMEPISNLDLEKIRDRGDSTEHHQFLLKQFLRASTSPLSNMKINPMVIIAIVAVVGIGAWFLLKK